MSKSVANVKTTSKDMFTDGLRKFSQIFPQFVSEGKIDFDALKAFLADKNALADEKDKYTFTWAGKKQSFQAISRPSYATLNPKIDESVDFDNTQNLFIEGDNLEVLKLLQKYYHGKIKMIYIDPPYNTGKDFIYKDNFTEGKSDYFERVGTTENGIKLETNSDAHGRYHSQWLSMMYPRLFLAKQLLREDGVIFISIDDNEQHHLKMLMNEVFGEGNFLNSIVLENDSRARPYGSIATTHEYIVAYSKNTDFIYEILSNPDKKFNYYDNEGGYDLYELRNRNIDFNINNRPNLYYSFWVNPNSKNDNDLYQISLEKEKGWVEVYPQESQGVKTVWRWGKDKAKSNLNTYIFAKKVDSNNRFRIVKKYRENTYTLRPLHKYE
jgi:adenine-specific DNA-methyltransferase